MREKDAHCAEADTPIDSSLEISDRAAANDSDQGGAASPPRYLSGWRLAALLTCLALCTFLVGLNESIVATATPRISETFNSVGDVSWYGTAYFLGSSCAILVFGQFYSNFPARPIFVVSLLVFEVGSLLCGLATSSKAFIAGRLIAGIGSAGVNTGCLTVLAHAVPLERRPIFSAIIDGGYGVATSCGPLVGGAITTRLSWRWCFLINAPPGALTIGALLVAYRDRYVPNGKSDTLLQRFWRLDIVSALLISATVACFILPLQWGGSKFAWSSPVIISLLVVSVVLCVVFIFRQARLGKNAMIGRHLFAEKDFAGATLYAFLVGGTANVLEFYLPIWFQAVWGVDALQSGIYTIPMVAGFVVFSIAAGFGVSHTGYYLPFMYLGSFTLLAGSASLTSIRQGTRLGSLVGFELLIGVGGGAGIQQAYLAAQAVLPESDVAIGLAMIVFAQTMGGTVSLSAAGSAVQNSLVGQRGGSPDTTKWNSQDDAAIRTSFYVAVATSGLSVLSLALLKLRSIKGGGAS